MPACLKTDSIVMGLQCRANMVNVNMGFTRVSFNADRALRGAEESKEQCSVSRYVVVTGVGVYAVLWSYQYPGTLSCIR